MESWKLYLVVFLLATCGSGCAPLVEMPTDRPAPIPKRKRTSPVNLSRLPVNVSHDGQLVEIKDLSLSTDYTITGPLPFEILAAALKKYPKATKFKINWSANAGSSWTDAKALFNRRAKMLKFDDKGGQGDFQSEGHVLYSQVTDAVIHKAAIALRSANNRENNQDNAGFFDLAKHGCKQQSINTGTPG